MASGGGEASKKLKLYSYWRSSCSCRVRIALNLKGLDYEYIAINLLKGENKTPGLSLFFIIFILLLVSSLSGSFAHDIIMIMQTLCGIFVGNSEFLKLNPLGYVPVLVDGDITVADSFAILLYLEEKYPQHPLLPQNIQKKALHYQAANIVYASIQPYQNIPIIGYIKEKLGPDEMLAWCQHHIRKGFTALEKLLENHAGKYATGDEPFLADLFLAPQIDGAVRRFNLDMNEFPLLSKINESYNEHPAFQDAMPGKQPDTPPEARVD